MSSNPQDWTYLLTGKSGYAWMSLAAAVSFGVSIVLEGVWELSFIILGAALFIGEYFLKDEADRFEFWMAAFIGVLAIPYTVGWLLGRNV